MKARWNQKFDVMMRLAIDLSSLSTCKRRQVGCVVTPSDFSRVYSIGYNGVARGRPNDSCTGESGKCGCVHAEANAVVKLGDVRDAWMLLTLSPCRECLSLVLNCGKISRVYYRDAWRDTSHFREFIDLGLDIRRATT